MAEINLENELLQAVRNGIASGVADKLKGYNSPLEKLLADIINSQSPKIRDLLTEAISSAVGDEEFRENIKTSTRAKLASILVQRFGGELEKQVNALKSDPATRARITLAIEEIVKTQPH